LDDEQLFWKDLLQIISKFSTLALLSKLGKSFMTDAARYEKRENGHR
jgi:hypothetical protein